MKQETAGTFFCIYQRWPDHHRRAGKSPCTTVTARFAAPITCRCMQVCAQRRYLNDARYSGMGRKLEQTARTFHMDVVKTVRAVLAEDAGRIHHDIHAAQQFANSAARWVGELEGDPVCISRTPTHSGCIPHAQVHLMSTSHKMLRQRAANQP